VVIFIHGGGFVSGDKKQTKQYCMTLAKEGYVVFNINYRLAPHSRNFEQINDVLSAMKWVKENSNIYQGDDSKVIFAGDSAGAYLAGLAAIISTNEELAAKLNLKPVFSGKEIRGILLFSGLYDLETGSRTGFPSIKSDIEIFLGTDDIRGYKYLREFSVTGNITSKFPKTFISSGAIDWLHSESVELISTLDRNKVYHSELLFEKSKKKAMHNYQLRLDLDISKQCMKRALEFLEFVVK
jgi:acetyl esterase/lipase